MKKQIWIINQTAGTPISGWGERHYYLSRFWVKNGYQTTTFSGTYNHLFINQPVKNSKSFNIDEIEEDIRFCWVKIKKYNPNSVFKLWSMIVFAFKMFFIPSNKFKKPDVVLISSMPLFSVIPAYFIAKKFKAKLLFEVRDLWPETPIHLKGYSKWHPVVLCMKYLEKFGYRKSNAIISVLPNAFHYINKISNNPDKFNYIPNGIDDKLIGKLKNSNDVIANIKKDKFVIGYTGTLGLANAMEFFIDASIILKNNTQIQFVIVGDGYLKEELRRKVISQDNIIFINKIEKSYVQDMISYFDVCYVGRFDSPLYNHGVSYNKYFDYMLAKKPILESSNLIKDPVELSGCGLIVKPEDSQAIVDGILELKKLSTESLDKLGEKGYSYVKKYHNFEYLSERYMQLF